MKTAISMPDETFSRVTRAAETLRMSRSELLTKAAVEFLDRLDSDNLTEELNRFFESYPEAAAGDRDVIEYGKRRLREMDDDW